VGKGTIVLDDFEHAEAIFVMGQNTGTNSPRMMSNLVEARKRGVPIVAVNPMPERALIRFTEPQDVVQMATFGSTEITSEFVHVRIGGDLALIKGMMKVMFEREAQGESVLDHAFLAEHTVGLEALREDVLAQDWDEIVRVSGIAQEQIRRCAEIYIRSQATVICYGMGLTQHQQGSRLLQQVARSRRRATWIACSRCLVSIRRASTATMWSSRSRRCSMAAPRCSSAWAATSSMPCPIPSAPTRPCADWN